MKNDKKFIEEKRQRIEIIHDNFFMYLKKRKMTQAEYASASDISESTISKWKSKTSHMNEVYIKQATEILKITVNDLYYTEEEKKTISVLSDSLYDPIMATQQIKINMMSKSFKNPQIIGLTTISLSIVLAIVVYFVTKYSAFWSLLSLIIPLCARIDFKQQFIDTKTYSINYLDDVYYLIKNENNQYYETSSLLHGLQAIFILICFWIMGYRMSVHDIFTESEALFFIAILLAISESIITMLMFKDKKLKKKIYDKEIYGYVAKLINMYTNAILLIFGSSLLSSSIKLNWYIMIILILNLIFSIIEFTLTSKKYNEYKMVYEEYGKAPRELFPNNYDK